MRGISGGPESRSHCAETLRAVTADHEKTLVTLDDHEPLDETAYLSRSPANARRVLVAIERLEHGGGIDGDSAE